jgi:light-regulated signal transduction histidine kinase (bacteriophytochrome)
MKKEKVHSDEEVLSECDREPIHLSGAIQPSGALIAFDWNTLAITHLSQNLGDYFPVEPSGLIGLKLNEVSELSALWNALSGLHNSYLGQANDHRLIGVNSQAPEFSGQAKIISVHLSVKNDTAIVDIEDDEASPIELLSSFKLFAETIKGCRKSVSLSKCAHAIAESIRSIVKYDRVT